MNTSRPEGQTKGGGTVYTRRLVAGYMVPLMLWGFFLSVPLLDVFHRYRWVLGLATFCLLVSLNVALRPLVRETMEATARFQGCRVDDLSCSPGLGGLLGLTEREPWWMTWSVVAAWVALPQSVAMLFLGFLPARAVPSVQDHPYAAMSAIGLAGFLAAFLLAPVVRALAGRREAAGDARPAGEDRPA